MRCLLSFLFVCLALLIAAVAASLLTIPSAAPALVALNAPINDTQFNIVLVRLAGQEQITSNLSDQIQQLIIVVALLAATMSGLVIVVSIMAWKRYRGPHYHAAPMYSGMASRV